MSPRSKILVVEDDPSVRRLLSSVLSQQFEVSVAMDAVGAVSVARRERPDLVILDFGLPAGNGALVLERLRAIPFLSTTPVLMISGSSSGWSWEGLGSMDLVGFLLKPFTPDELLDEVCQALGTDRVTVS
jgi:putative two-component system response regulator